MTLFRGVLSDRIAVSEAVIASSQNLTFPEERQALKNAVPSRLREFATGRACARRAMAALGYDAIALPPDSDRVPQWPEGVVGSITHTDTMCVAAVACRRDGFRSIGIDLEPAEPLPVELYPYILTSTECERIEKDPLDDRGVLARAIFSAKESVFKAQFIVSRAMMEFQDLEVSVDRDRASFTAQFLRDVHEFQRGTALNGRIRISSGWCATGVVMRSD